MATKKKHKQITLHFDENSEYILDAVKERCAKSFRTPEQEMIFTLSCCIVKKGELIRSFEAFKKEIDDLMVNAFSSKKDPAAQAAPKPEDAPKAEEAPKAEPVDDPVPSTVDAGSDGLEITPGTEA